MFIATDKGLLAIVRLFTTHKDVYASFLLDDISNIFKRPLA